MNEKSGKVLTSFSQLGELFRKQEQEETQMSKEGKTSIANQLDLGEDDQEEQELEIEEQTEETTEETPSPEEVVEEPVVEETPVQEAPAKPEPPKEPEVEVNEKWWQKEIRNLLIDIFGDKAPTDVDVATIRKRLADKARRERHIRVTQEEFDVLMTVTSGVVTDSQRTLALGYWNEAIFGVKEEDQIEQAKAELVHKMKDVAAKQAVNSVRKTEKRRELFKELDSLTSDVEDVVDQLNELGDPIELDLSIRDCYTQQDRLSGPYLEAVEKATGEVDAKVAAAEDAYRKGRARIITAKTLDELAEFFGCKEAMPKEPDLNEPVQERPRKVKKSKKILKSKKKSKTKKVRRPKNDEA